MKPSLEYYRTFFAVAQSMSFSKAAKTLFVSQSSVSQTLAKLEAQLGVTLINRTTKQMQLSDAGQILCEALNQSFALIDSAEKRIDKLINQREGTVNLGISDSLCKYLFMSHLTRYKSLYPNIQLAISNQPSAQSLQALASGTIDVAIVNLMPEQALEQFDVNVIQSFYDVIITRTTDHNNGHITAEQFFDKPFISLAPDSTSYRYSQQLFRRAGKLFQPDIVLSNLDLVVDFVRAGFGVAIVPDYAVKNDKAINALALPVDQTERSIAIVTTQFEHLPLAVKAFIMFLKKLP